MGGKALSVLGITVDRIEGKTYYQTLCLRLCTMLQKYYKQVEALPQCSWKESFGDIDILVCEPILPLDIPMSIKRGDYTSFLYEDAGKKYQVDLIHLQPSFFAFGKFQLFSDMSACLGGICKKMNLKFSHDGLWYCGSEIGNKLLLTSDVNCFLRFMGIDVSIQPFGVKSYEEFFAYLLTCHFDLRNYIINTYESFLIDPIAKGLDRKSKNFKNNRQCFIRFVAYCKEYSNKKQYKELLPPEECIASFGEEKLLEYQARKEMLRMHEAFRKKCNGKRFQRLLGLEGAELGSCIESFVCTYGKEQILSMEENALDSLIMSFGKK